MDSAVDLASGFTLWLAAHQMSKARPYTYPTGSDLIGQIVFVENKQY